VEVSKVIGSLVLRCLCSYTSSWLFLPLSSFIFNGTGIDSRLEGGNALENGHGGRVLMELGNLQTSGSS